MLSSFEEMTLMRSVYMTFNQYDAIWTTADYLKSSSVITYQAKNGRWVAKFIY